MMLRQFFGWSRVTSLMCAVGIGVGAWLSASAAAQEIPITLEKQVKEADPVVSVRSVGEDKELAESLRRVLAFSGWFQLQTAVGGEADYSIEAERNSAQEGELLLKVRSKNGGFRVRTRGGKGIDMLCRAAVDSLILEVFNRPGPCLSLIAFVNGERRKEISLIHPDGRGARTLTQNGTISTEPNWGGTAGQLVYTLYRNHRSETILIDILADRQRRIARQSGLNAGAALAPDGKRVAVCLSEGNQVDLYLRRVGERKLQRLTSDGAVEASPGWSPDGRSLCYVSDRSGVPQIYLMDRDGGNRRRLLKQSAESVSPDWSPDGRKIVFALRKDGRYRLGYLDLSENNAEPVVFTDSSSDWESPSWAPDSRHVVCTRSNGSQRSIVMVDTRDGSVQPLTRRGNYALPDWSDPLPLR
ncbi:MAG: hypothetical protein ACOCUY_03530 [Verrucomicrobiota bacterium]